MDIEGWMNSSTNRWKQALKEENFEAVPFAVETSVAQAVFGMTEIVRGVRTGDCPQLVRGALRLGFSSLEFPVLVAASGGLATGAVIGELVERHFG